jgi:hypothetical protein
MRTLSILVFSSLLLGSPSFGQTQALQPAPAHFTIHQGEQSVGTATYDIRPDNGGYRVTSHGNLHVTNLAYAFSKTERLDQNLEIVSENLSGTVNGSAVTVDAHPDSNKFNLNISANGQAYQNSLDRHPQTVFFPDFDLSSYEVLLRITGAHAGSPQPWALIPKQTGILMNLQLAKQPDMKGTLNGASTAVRHYTLTIGSVSSEVFATKDGRVLEVDVPSQGFAIVRDQFQLQPPAEPGAAPAQPQDSQQ